MGQTQKHQDEWLFGFTPDQVEIARANFPFKVSTDRGMSLALTEDDFRHYLYRYKALGMDPGTGVIHATARWNKGAGRFTMALVTGIDVLCAAADRTGRYASGPEPVYEYDGGDLVSCRASLVKLTGPNYIPVNCEYRAHFYEYVQRTREGDIIGLWKQMPHVMLAKCALALCIRRNFGEATAGLYEFAELSRADDAPVHGATVHQIAPAPAPADIPDTQNSGFRWPSLEAVRAWNADLYRLEGEPETSAYFDADGMPSEGAAAVILRAAFDADPDAKLAASVAKDIAYFERAITASKKFVAGKPLPARAEWPAYMGAAK